MTKQEAKFEQHYMNCDVCAWEAKRVVILKDMIASKLCRIGRRMFHGIFGMLILFLSVACFAGTCGVERHDVKDLMDGVTVDRESAGSTVTALRALAPPSKVTGTLPRQPEETKSFVLSAWLLGYKLESDQDYHVVISQQGDKAQTMVVEIPSPTCVKDPHLMVLFFKERAFIDHVNGKAGKKIKWLAQPVAIKVSGVLFFDKIHGQDGVAPNGVELHPVLSISK